MLFQYFHTKKIVTWNMYIYSIYIIYIADYVYNLKCIVNNYWLTISFNYLGSRIKKTNFTQRKQIYSY